MWSLSCALCGTSCAIYICPDACKCVLPSVAISSPTPMLTREWCIGEINHYNHLIQMYQVLSLPSSKAKLHGPLVAYEHQSTGFIGFLHRAVSYSCDLTKYKLRSQFSHKKAPPPGVYITLPLHVYNVDSIESCMGGTKIILLVNEQCWMTMNYRISSKCRRSEI